MSAAFDRDGCIGDGALRHVQRAPTRTPERVAGAALCVHVVDRGPCVGALLPPVQRRQLGGQHQHHVGALHRYSLLLFPTL